MIVSNVQIQKFEQYGIHLLGNPGVCDAWNIRLDTIAVLDCHCANIKLESASMIYGSQWYCVGYTQEGEDGSETLVDIVDSANIELHTVRLGSCSPKSSYAVKIVRSRDVHVYGVTTETIKGLGHILLQGGDGVDMMGGGLQQEGDTVGIVFKDDDPSPYNHPSRNIHINLPRWTTNKQPRIKIDADAVWEVHLGLHADGRFGPADVVGRPYGQGPGKLDFCSPHFQPAFVPGVATFWETKALRAGEFDSCPVVVRGAQVGDPCTVGYAITNQANSQLPVGMQLTAIVAKQHEVIVTLFNHSGKDQPVLAGTLQVAVWKHDYFS